MAHFAARLRVAERADSLCEIDVLPLARSDVEGSRSAVEVSLAERCAGCLTVTAFWHTGALHPLAVLSLATGGWASCVAVISPRSGAPSATVAQEQEGGSAQQHHLLHGLARLHAECTAATKTAVAAPLAPGRELHLVAVPGATRFWLFDAVPGAATTYHALLTAKRVPLVMDLDETLLQAVTLRSFDERCDAAAKRAATASQDSARRGALECDLGRLLADRATLQEYAAQDAVTVGGNRIAAVPEAADEDGIVVTRPVIRLPGGVVLTRIDPGRRETSMLVRLRPGWDSLRAYLAGEEPGSHRHEQQGGAAPLAATASAPRPRFEVFVCTLSERGYAREMWRLLDPTNRLIPPHLRSARIVSTPPDRLKHLSDALGGCAKEASLAPWALIVDDRPSVWSEAHQAHVLPVPPFLPYAAADAALSVPTSDSCVAAWPMQATRAALEATRGGLYRYMDTQFVPKCAALGQGSEVMPSHLPPLPSAAEALRSHRERIGVRPADVPVTAPPEPAGDPWRGDIAALIAQTTAGVPSSAAARFASAAMAAAAVAPPGASGRSSGLSILQVQPSSRESGGGLNGIASGDAATGLPGNAMPAPDSSVQALRIEVERRGGVVDWDCRYDKLGRDDRVYTATAYLAGVPLATSQGPNMRVAKESAATAALAKLGGGSGDNGAVAKLPPALSAATLARMANLAGAPGGDKPLSAMVAVSTLSVYWERLESSNGSNAGASSAAGPMSLEYRLVEPAAAPGQQSGDSVRVELWAGRPARAIASGTGPGRKEATQRAALAALRQEGFQVPDDVLLAQSEPPAMQPQTIAQPPAPEAFVAQPQPPVPMEEAGGVEGNVLKRKAEDESVMA